MRTKSGYVKEEYEKRQNVIFEYVCRVIKSCRTYEHIMTTQAWIYVIPDFKHWGLTMIAMSHLVEREKDIGKGWANKDIQ